MSEDSRNEKNEQWVGNVLLSSQRNGVYGACWRCCFE